MLPEVMAAAALLRCRPDASAGEVRTAYRRALLAARPDLGLAGPEWLQAASDARDLLLAAARPDRRRRPRSRPAGGAFVPLRRAAWGLGEGGRADGGRPAVDVRL